MISTTEMLKDVRDEIARLQRLEAALIEAAGGSAPQQKSRISPSGSLVIALAAKLRHARKKGDKGLVRKLEKDLKAAKAAKAKA
jgi:hypothetical protein